MLEKPKLFISAKEFWVTFIFFLFVLLLRLFLLYGDYSSLISKPFYFTEVEVLQQYEKSKDGQSYTILRLYSPELDLNFFSRTHRKDNLLGRRLRVKLFPTERITFLDYLSTAYISSEINRVDPPREKLHTRISAHIAQQHQSRELASFYQAIFLATPLPKELRDQISKLGVSHLVALSGLHLAILSGILFLLLRPLYRPLQQRFFPYRFDLIDLGFVVLLLLGLYLYGVDSPASLLRSYMMMLLGWMVLLLGIELLSFDFLLITTMLLLLIFPKLLFSLAFGFSIMGVFYIFLLLKWFQGISKIGMTLLISFGLFVLMMPIVHMVFPLSTPLQLYSPLLSLLFSFFYPLSLALHLLGWGDLLDPYLLDLFALESAIFSFKVSLIFGIAYMLLSLGAIYSRWLFYLLLLLALTFAGGMFIPFMLS